MELGPGEPAAGPWRVERLDRLAAALKTARVVAVDGRGGSGKTTLAERIAGLLPDSAIVHTDDVAWHHSRFGWADLMIDGILTPMLAGDDVHYQPPAWAPRGRTGHLEVPAATRTLIIEGVGASRRELSDKIDFAIWAQSDAAGARERGLSRDRILYGTTEEEAFRNWEDWEVEEIPFLLDDRPWERADLIAATTPTLPHDPETELVISSQRAADL